MSTPPPPPPPGSPPPPPPAGGSDPSNAGGSQPPPPPPPPPSGGPNQPSSSYGAAPPAAPGVPAPVGTPAGFWIRLAGLLLDSILYGLVMVPFVVLGGVLMAFAFDDCYTTVNDEIRCDGDFGWAAFFGGGLVMALGVILAIVLYIRALGRTGQPWGAKIVGIKVLRTDGSNLGVGRALGRALFAGFISGQICYLGYLWAIWDDRNQTWHDKVVDSTVVQL